MAFVTNRTIPEFTILTATADAVKENLKAKAAVYLKIDLSISHPDNRVEWDLWYSSVLEVPKETWKGLNAVYNLFKKDAKLTPRINICMPKLP